MSTTRRPCDLVMKGGVTSGVVYPAAVYQISRAFDLKSIGGTSAGAIAAALAAAAQYRRIRRAGQSDAEAGYERLAQVPDWLGSDGHLLGLFAPNRATQKIFETILDQAEPGGNIAGRLVRFVKRYALAAVLGAVPGAFYALAASQLRIRYALAVHELVALGVIAFGALACATAAFALDIWRKVPANGFGLVTGLDDRGENANALCTWLARELELSAGLEAGKAPLTFGMLWSPQADPPQHGPRDRPDEPEIDLQMITTSLGEGRPVRLPCRTDRYYFRREELARYFPPHVLAWMEQNARQDGKRFEGFTALPQIGDLPVVVATRMSLSFPFLFSAVPLHAVDYADDPEGAPQPVWFSDGGLSSNFPIALFDSPLPRRPTLALNLGSTSDEVRARRAGVEAGMLRYATSNAAGRLSGFVAIASLGGFFGAILNVMQNWTDSTLAAVPGYRDRIVTIELKPDEGGFNLKMGRAAIEDLEARGKLAGEFLVERFSAPSTLEPGTGMSWENHRWVRYRTFMSTFRAYLARFHDGFENPIPPDVPYSALIESDDPQARPRKAYPLSNDPEVRKRVAALTFAVDQLAQALEKEDGLDDHAPRPLPELVIRPRLDV